MAWGKVNHRVIDRTLILTLTFESASDAQQYLKQIGNRLRPRLEGQEIILELPKTLPVSNFSKPRANALALVFKKHSAARAFEETLGPLAKRDAASEHGGKTVVIETGLLSSNSQQLPKISAKAKWHHIFDRHVSSNTSYRQRLIAFVEWLFGRHPKLPSQEE